MDAMGIGDWIRACRRVEIGERGILDPRLGLGWIPWDEIEGAYPESCGRADRVRLRLRVTERLARLLSRRSRCARRLGPLQDHVEVELDLSRSDPSAIDVVLSIVNRTPAGQPVAPSRPYFFMR
jgi:hypothetical protein